MGKTFGNSSGFGMNSLFGNKSNQMSSNNNNYVNNNNNNNNTTLGGNSTTSSSIMTSTQQPKGGSSYSENKPKIVGRFGRLASFGMGMLGRNNK
jgi:hypothetical protein